MELRRIDLTDDTTLLQAFHLESAITTEMQGPTWTPLPADIRIRHWKQQPGFTFTLIGAWEENELIGLGQLCFWEKEPQDFFIQVAVDEGFRHQGIGTQLVHALERSARSSAHRFLAEVVLSDSQQVTALAEGFAKKNGYRLGTVEICLETTLSETPDAHLELDDGWRITTHVDGIPLELRPEVGVIQGLVDEEAPSGDIDWHAHVVTPQEYQADLDEILAEGAHLVEAVAHSPYGEVAGWSGLTSAVTPKRPARVQGTLVLEKFRGHGLGMALKTAVAQRAAQIGVRRLATESNEANSWMLDINRRQGFTETGVHAAFHKEG